VNNFTYVIIILYMKSKASSAMTESDTGNRVPALEKGLDIIEALSAERGALLQKEVALRVGRSVNEIFRVLNALEARGYVVRDDATGAYSLTLRLFELGHIHPPTRRLIEVSTGQMEKLSSNIGCSCHLVTPHQERLIVLAQAQPDALLMGWSVKVGAAFPMNRRFASARTIAAHQHQERQEKMMHLMLIEEPSLDRDGLLAELVHIRDNGFEVSSSSIAPGVTDISCPILNHLGDAVAAITVPRVGNMPEPQLSVEQVVIAVKETANAVSKAIGGQ
jgi:DNA-binding IclR family transcriptional regulator